MDTRRATEGPAGVLDSTSRSPTERNAVDMPGSASAVESWVEMRVNSNSGGMILQDMDLDIPVLQEEIAMRMGSSGRLDIRETFEGMRSFVD
jgi:hypothetical protein